MERASPPVSASSPSWHLEASASKALFKDANASDQRVETSAPPPAANWRFRASWAKAARSFSTSFARKVRSALRESMTSLKAAW
eukprot:Skav206467  [mRNA]  locus=scaffold1672:19272:25697:- [translate_table: standard]